MFQGSKPVKGPLLSNGRGPGCKVYCVPGESFEIKGAEEGEWTLFSFREGRTEAVFIGWKRALAAGPSGRRDPLTTLLGGSECRHTKAVLKNHCPVAKRLCGPPERHFLCSHETEGQSSP